MREPYPPKPAVLDLDTLAGILTDSPRNPVKAREALEHYLAASSIAFCRVAFDYLAGERPWESQNFLMEILRAHNLHLRGLLVLDLPAEAAAAILRKLAVVEKQPALKLLQFANAHFPNNSLLVERALAFVEALQPGPELVPDLQDLLANQQNERIRSKVVLLLGQLRHASEWLMTWVRIQMSKPDARMRANIIESIWGGASANARVLFNEAAQDPNWRVAANALIGLYYAGDATAAARIIQMARHHWPEFRAAAAFAMGKVLDPVFLPVLSSCMNDVDGRVRRNAFKSMRRIRMEAATKAKDVTISDP